MTTTSHEVAEALTLDVHLGDPRTVAEILAATNAIAHGHFELLSGDHADSFIRFSRVAERPTALETTIQWLLPSVAAWLPEAVLVPSTAGVALGWMLAQRLGLPLALADVGPDGRANGVHGADAIREKRLVLVNDVVTTGHGIATLAGVAADAGGTVAGATWFLSRSTANVGAMIGAPVSYVGELLLPHWSPTSCPLCGRGEPITPGVEIN